MTDGQRQRDYLKAMGIPVWQSRPGFFREREVLAPVVEQKESEPQPEPLEVTAETPETKSVVEQAPLVETRVEESPEVIPAPEWDWNSLQAEVAQCHQCELSQTRTKTVFGVGNPQADWLIIGEAPGQDEDRQGEPFVGEAGQLLDKMLLAIGLQREEVFITNTLKCHPQKNRDPQRAEIEKCETFLQRQIEWIKPKIILSVGKVSAQNLLKSDQAIGDLRGRVHHFGPHSIPLVVTYHPAYLLRQPSKKRRAWEDLKMAVRLTRGE